MRSRASAGCAGAHGWARLRPSLRYRHRPLPELGGSLKIIAAIEDPVIVRILTHLTCRPAPRRAPGAGSRFIPDNLRAENRLPTQADGAARSEFERAARAQTSAGVMLVWARRVANGSDASKAIVTTKALIGVVFRRSISSCIEQDGDARSDGTLLHLLDGGLLHAPSRLAWSAYSTPCVPRSLATSA